MELQEFISRTLLAITQGVEDANKESNRFQLSGQIHERGTSGETVQFNVVVDVSESNEGSGGGKGKITVPGLNIGGELGAEKKSSKTNSTQHQLQFKVFVTEK